MGASKRGGAPFPSAALPVGSGSDVVPLKESDRPSTSPTVGRDFLSPFGGELERGQESPLAAPEPGVEQVPHGVAEHV